METLRTVALGTGKTNIKNQQLLKSFYFHSTYRGRNRPDVSHTPKAERSWLCGHSCCPTPPLGGVQHPFQAHAVYVITIFRNTQRGQYYCCNSKLWMGAKHTKTSMNPKRPFLSSVPQSVSNVQRHLKVFIFFFKSCNRSRLKKRVVLSPYRGKCSILGFFF